MAVTFDRLGTDRVLIVLESGDLDDFSLDFEKLSLEDAYSRKILMRILRLACFKSGIEISGKSVLMEAIPIEGDCYILVTVQSRSSGRRYKIKQNSHSLCYCMGKSGNFLNAIEKLYRQNVCCNKNSAYLYEGEYFLIFDYPSVPKKLKRVLSEYGERRGGSVHSARVRENGRELCGYNAIWQIGKFL